MNIVVLAGGISTERDVSLITGKNVVNALRSVGENAVLLDVFLGYKGDISSFFEDGAQNHNAINDIGIVDPSIEDIKKARGTSSNSLFGENVIEICKMADFVFLALHGEDGEDGKVQATFDLLDIKYSGSGCLASAMAMNKYISKQMMDANGIKNAKYIFAKKENANLKYEYPCVIKPTSGGSSVGISIVKSEEDFENAVKTAFKYEDEIIIEEFIEGREFSVGVLGDTVLPPIEIIPKEGFYDYKNKYQAGMTIEICPAELSKEDTKRLQENTKRVFDVLNLEVYGRIDFILSKENNEFYCLEANSLPGLTSMSLLPQEAQAIGIDYPCLCKKIIELSQKKY
ncbi:MAG: D-alanine--D-alanine ligase [Eubacterium sp.]|nr:D-alanine--D-alanine ligase [Eubacterium sp.]